MSSGFPFKPAKTKEERRANAKAFAAAETEAWKNFKNPVYLGDCTWKEAENVATLEERVETLERLVDELATQVIKLMKDLT